MPVPERITSHIVSLSESMDSVRWTGESGKDGRSRAVKDENSFLISYYFSVPCILSSQPRVLVQFLNSSHTDASTFYSPTEF